MSLRTRVQRLWRGFRLRQRLGIARIEEFDRTARRSEWLARSAPGPAAPATAFEEMVAEAIDQLPEEFQDALMGIPVVVSDGGDERHAYGLYEGDTIARDHWADRIVIFQDTLTRDFGHDPLLLRAQIERTVRHELAHHLGWDEPGVHGLGL